jgi:cyclohexanone monooxygenase
MRLCFEDLSTDLEANETAAEFARNKIRSIVRGPAAAELLVPKGYPMFTKRVCLDSGYYEVFNQDNVTLVDVRMDPIAEIVETGVRTESGSGYDLDVLVFATGFDAMTGPLVRLNLVGPDRVPIESKWAAGPRTYLGVATAGFPSGPAGTPDSP